MLLVSTNIPPPEGVFLRGASTKKRRTVVSARGTLTSGLLHARDAIVYPRELPVP